MLCQGPGEAPASHSSLSSVSSEERERQPEEKQCFSIHVCHPVVFGNLTCKLYRVVVRGSCAWFFEENYIAGI